MHIHILRTQRQVLKGGEKFVHCRRQPGGGQFAEGAFDGAEHFQLAIHRRQRRLLSQDFGFQHRVDFSNDAGVAHTLADHRAVGIGIRFRAQVDLLTMITLGRGIGHIIADDRQCLLGRMDAADADFVSGHDCLTPFH
ncbi:MAG: hypothetical protein BWY83_02876 [bacterium ADurb.Bin478]|nr:MAG: hypothetical protein BWY83_02876 [bacterium ADurb.Bin478]